MNRVHIVGLLVLACSAVSLFVAGCAGSCCGGTWGCAPDVSKLKKDWVDADTGHLQCCYRLSVENGSGNLYFHYNAYSADGKKVVFNSPSGIMAADLASKKAELIVPGATAMETARASNEVFFKSDGAVMAADLDTKKIRQVVAIPQGLSVACVNCDGTLFAGVIDNVADPDGNDKAAKPDKIASEDQLSVMFARKKHGGDFDRRRSLPREKENGLAKRLECWFAGDESAVHLYAQCEDGRGEEVWLCVCVAESSAIFANRSEHAAILP